MKIKNNLATQTSYNLKEIFKVSLFDFCLFTDYRYDDSIDLWTNGISSCSNETLSKSLGNDYVYKDNNFYLKPHILIEYKSDKKTDIMLYDDYELALNDFTRLNKCLSDSSLNFCIL